MNKFKVEHGIVVRDGDGSKVSVLEYWNHANGQDVSPEGLQMLGFAIPFLEIENSVLPRLRIGLRTEVLKG